MLYDRASATKGNSWLDFLNYGTAESFLEEIRDEMTCLNASRFSHNGFQKQNHYIIVFITIIVIFHHFVFAQKKTKNK